MKVLGFKAVIILVLSLAVWYFFAVSFPSAPPTAEESVVIVGFTALVVLGVPFLLTRLRRPSPGPADGAVAESRAGERAAGVGPASEAAPGDGASTEEGTDDGSAASVESLVDGVVAAVGGAVTKAVSAAGAAVKDAVSTDGKEERP